MSNPQLHVYKHAKNLTKWHQHLSLYNEMKQDITGRHSQAAKRHLIEQCTDTWMQQGGQIYNEFFQPMNSIEAFEFVKKSLRYHESLHPTHKQPSKASSLKEPPSPPPASNTSKPQAAVVTPIKPPLQVTFQIGIDSGLPEWKRKRQAPKFLIDEMDLPPPKKQNKRTMKQQQQSTLAQAEDVYHKKVPKRARGKKISAPTQRLLKKLGFCRDFIDYAADVYFDWHQKARSLKASTTKPWTVSTNENTHQFSDETIAMWLLLHQAIKDEMAAIDENGNHRWISPRENWVDHIDERVQRTSGSAARTRDRVFIGLVCMILSPVQTDVKLFGLIHKLPYTCPSTLFKWARDKGNWTDGTLQSLVNILGRKAHFCSMNFRKTRYIVFAAIVFLIGDRELGPEEQDLVRSPEGMISFRGVSLKVLFETQQGLLHNVIGIGCDSHMVTMFEHFRWITKRSIDSKGKPITNFNKTALEMMAWMPYSEWECMNRTYAGMAQICQSGLLKRNKFAQALRARVRSMVDKHQLEEYHYDLVWKLLDMKKYNGSVEISKTTK